MDLHQQTGLSAGTITNDDKLATDLSHGGCSGDSQMKSLEGRAKDGG